MREITDNQQESHERRLQTAKRLLAEADTDAAVIEHCQAVLARPGHCRCYSQATLDACSALLALAQADVSTKRTREARQVLTAVAGGRR